jgi:hypothetical protein
MWPCGDSLLLKVVMKSLNAETQSTQRKIRRRKEKRRQENGMTKVKKMPGRCQEDARKMPGRGPCPCCLD